MNKHCHCTIAEAAIDKAKAHDVIRRGQGMDTLMSLDEVSAACFRVLTELIDLSDSPYSAQKVIAAAATAVVQRGLTVEFNHRFTQRLGDATFSLNRVRFSKPLWERAGYASRLNTIQHEVAHLVANEVEPGAAHGPVWRMVADFAGCDGKRCHAVPRADLRRGGTRFPAKCKCMTHYLSQVRVTRMRQGRTYFHGGPTGCGGRLELIDQ